MENPRNKQFICFKTCAILSSVMKPCTIPLCPARDVNYPVVEHKHYLPMSHSVTSPLSDQVPWHHRVCVPIKLI